MLSFGSGWNLIAPPCDNDPLNTRSRAYTKTICANEIAYPLCDESCCFTIVYQYRWLPGDLFELNISGVTYDGDEACKRCIHQIVPDRLIEIFNEISYCPTCPSYIPNFKSRLTNQAFNDWGEHSDPKYDAWAKISSTGKCYEDSILCDSQIRCCWQRAELVFDHYVDSITGFQIDSEISINDSCPDPPDCKHRCWENNNIRLDSVVGSKFCDVPCNTGKWSYIYKQKITYGNCAGCFVDIYYRYRKTINCNPNYKDIELIWIDFYGNCFNCLTSMNYLYRFAWNWLLLNAEIDFPLKNQCDTTYRAITAPCWKDIVIEVLFPINTTFKSCSDSACCWTAYEICDYETIIRFNKLGGGINFEPWLCYLEDSCSVYCNFLPDSSSRAYVTHPKQNGHSLPNSDTILKDIICPNYLIIDDVLKLKFNFLKDKLFTIEIFDLLGNVHYISTFADKNNNMIEIGFKNFSNGYYYYQIRNNIDILCSGSIIVFNK